MNNPQAKKIALRRAWKILDSTMAAGWEPNENGAFQYSETDSNRILDAMNEICGELMRRSLGNLEDSPIKH